MWKRFKPRTRGKLADQTVYEPDSLYAHARAVVTEMMQSVRSGWRGERDGVKRSTQAARALRQRDAHDAVHLLALLILQAPAAAKAQREMDSHHGGYKNRQARIFELIDFNDTFVDTVFALPDHDLVEFIERLAKEIEYFCERLHTPTFTDKQYEAITHGLSREIAVHRALRRAGFNVRMTSRVQDAMGVDMVITDPDTKKSINVDVKTHSSFHFRLVDLQRQDRIDEQRRLDCELAGFCKVRNGHGQQAVDTVLLRVATEHLGEIKNFDFVDVEPLIHLVTSALQHEGKYVISLSNAE
jgi:hypothetical protein